MNEYQLEFCPRTALPDTFISTACQATGPEMPEVLTPRDAQAVTGRIRITATALRPFIRPTACCSQGSLLVVEEPEQPLADQTHDGGQQDARTTTREGQRPAQ